MLRSVTHPLTGPVARVPRPEPAPATDRGPRTGAAAGPGRRRSEAVGGPGADAPGDVQGDVHLETRRARLVVRFEGEIDTAVRARFDRVLAVVRAAHEPVEVDCRDVTFFGAEGVRMLMLLQPAAGGPGVTALRSSPWVDRALRLSGVGHYPARP